MNEYTIISKLGEGAFSVVYKVKRKQDGQQYAMKKMKIMNFNDKQVSNCLNEVRILASVEDEHIVSYRDSFYDQSSKIFCIVTQFLDGGDLAHHISKCKHAKKPIPQKMIWEVAYRILKGLQSLHAAKILHRDIKSANVFLGNDQKTIKLGDMNVSIISSNGMAKTQTGTPYYASPEVWNDKPYSAKCDIWSLGCILHEMATFRLPFLSNEMRTLKRMISTGTVKRIPLNYSDQLWQLIRVCLRVNPEERLSAEELLKQKNYFAAEENKKSNKGCLKIIQKIKAPKKREFRIIKDRLPKHRFSCQKTVSNHSCMLDTSKETNKENVINSSTASSTKLVRKDNHLPALRRPTSASHKLVPIQKQQKKHSYQVQIIEPCQKPPMPRSHALRG